MLSTPGLLALAIALCGVLWSSRPHWVPLIDPRPLQYAQVEQILGASLNMVYTERLARVVSPYQAIEVYQTAGFGKVLVIDDDLMLTDRDHMSYHEMIAHVPLAYRAH